MRLLTAGFLVRVQGVEPILAAFQAAFLFERGLTLCAMSDYNHTSWLQTGLSCRHISEYAIHHPHYKEK